MKKTEKHRLLVWDHVRERETIIGHATRAFPVYDTKVGAVKFFKECWQTDNLTPEADTLRLLEDHGVPNVPTLFLGGMVPNHVTKSQDYLTSSWYKGHSDSILARRSHWLLLNEVGTPVESFKSPRQFLQVTRDAFVGMFVSPSFHSS